jgi:hypothetical protein
MRTRAALIVMLYVASATAASAEALVRHAGEWETTIDNGQPRIVCFPTDVTMDQSSIMQSMAKLPGANCTISDFKTSGAVTNYSTQCTIGGSQMTSSGTITVTGPDAFSTKGAQPWRRDQDAQRERSRYAGYRHGNGFAPARPL